MNKIAELFVIFHALTFQANETNHSDWNKSLQRWFRKTFDKCTTLRVKTKKIALLPWIYSFPAILIQRAIFAPSLISLTLKKEPKMCDL